MHDSKQPEVDDLVAQLTNEYSSTIETSTLLAILSDYNLADPSQLISARQTLNVLQESAEAEERTGFDASGSSSLGLLPANGGDTSRENESGSSKSPPASSSYTDDTPLSQAVSSLDLDGYDSSGARIELLDQLGQAYSDGLDGLDDEARVALLCGMFPTSKPFDIKWTYRKRKGDVNQVIDELMTQLFLVENGGRRKGIEAFSESDVSSSRRAKRGKRKNRQVDRVASDLVSDPPLQMSKWDAAKRDIDFISLRAGMPTGQVGSIYHKNGGSLRETIIAIIEAHLALKIEAEDPIIQSQAIDLSHEFPTISSPYLEALVQISHPSTTHSHELAEALTGPQPGGKPSIQLEFRRPPLQLDPLPTSPGPSPRKTTHSPFSASESPADLATKYVRDRDTAFTQARAAYRKGKSDRLMGGAAAYYSQEGRDAGAKARQAMSAAADKLVAAQSWKGGLDLHGVCVEDAKRIVREKVTGWWHELGQDRNRAVASSYRIVTGVGNHSEGGVGKLGPAVGKMLIREGWKIEVGTGVLVVTGVARAR